MRKFEGEELPSEFKLSRSKIMYIEDKSGDLEGEARIGGFICLNQERPFTTEA